MLLRISFTSAVDILTSSSAHKLMRPDAKHALHMLKKFGGEELLNSGAKIVYNKHRRCWLIYGYAADGHDVQTPLRAAGVLS